MIKLLRQEMRYCKKTSIYGNIRITQSCCDLLFKELKKVIKGKSKCTIL